jgi:hypothetical protein
MRLWGLLPANHLEAESRETEKLGIGLVATMTALVLGLVTANAKSSFDAADTALKETTIELLTLDRLLARYGPETAEIRNRLKRAVAARLETIWPKGSSTADLDSIRSGAAPASKGSSTRSAIWSRATIPSARSDRARSI